MTHSAVNSILAGASLVVGLVALGYIGALSRKVKALRKRADKANEQ